MRSIHVDPDAWEDFLYWLASDRKMAVRITRLIKEIQRDPFAGIGKPEPLKGDLSGYWSRRIDDEHRLVYRADDKEVKILNLAFNLPGSSWFPGWSSCWWPCPRRDGWPGAGSSSREVCRGRVCRVSVRL